MQTIFANIIAHNLPGISARQALKTITLLDDGAGIPFISRYRKEATGGLDEVDIGRINDEYERLKTLAERKKTIRKTIDEQGCLTPGLQQQIDDCWNVAQLEDLYLPYKPKRRTKAEIARKKGLEPLADVLMSGQDENNVEKRASQFVNDRVPSVEEALQGARDIIAERINEDATARNIVRRIFEQEAVISSKVIKGKETEGDKYRDYFEFRQPLRNCPSHRLLAIRRGEREGFLRVSIDAESEHCLEALAKHCVHGRSAAALQVAEAMTDAYKRLLKPSIETEFAARSKENADREAIGVFADNLQQLLLAPPLGERRVLAIDPGFRSGCKVVCLDAQGNLLHNETIFPHPPRNEKAKAVAKVNSLVNTYNLEAIAIGNGTASRETEDFIVSIHFNHKVQVFVVNENGASIYSASAIARAEFPAYDVTVRGAVSIGRRLMDPLAELVKIDPKSIGVGQYQHDVDQAELKKSLDRTVVTCVNRVGVNLNTAGRHLLVYVSGLNAALADNIVRYRIEHGPFRQRTDLMNVPRMGEKTFEQCAGFLRIPGAANPLDNSAIHPESYHIAEQMAADAGCSIADLIAIRALREKIVPDRYVTDTVGMPTLLNLLSELEKPGRDPRQTIRVLEFDRQMRTIHDLREGMELPGVVSNVTNFGCFVDIGIKENGLVHISELADGFVSDPTTVVSVHQQVRVRVISVDVERKRIHLSMKNLAL
jgi:uncharacterized protein